MGQSVEEIAQHLANQDKQVTQLKAELDTLRTDFKSASEQLKKLENEPDQDYTQRPPATGGEGQILATY